MTAALPARCGRPVCRSPSPRRSCCRHRSSASPTARSSATRRINPLIATLATLAIVRGLAYVISGGRELVITDPALLELRRRHALRHPVHRHHPASRPSWSSAGRCRGRCSGATPTPSARAPGPRSPRRRAGRPLADRVLRHLRRARGAGRPRLRRTHRQRPAERGPGHRARRHHRGDPRRHQPHRRPRPAVGHVHRPAAPRRRQQRPDPRRRAGLLAAGREGRDPARRRPLRRAAAPSPWRNHDGADRRHRLRLVGDARASPGAPGQSRRGDRRRSPTRTREIAARAAERFGMPADRRSPTPRDAGPHGPRRAWWSPCRMPPTPARPTRPRPRPAPPAREADDHPPRPTPGSSLPSARREAASCHQLPVALQPPGPGAARRHRRRPYRHRRVRVLPVRLDRARALSRQSRAVSGHPRLHGQPARRADLCRPRDRRWRAGPDPDHPQRGPAVLADRSAPVSWQP